MNKKKFSGSFSGKGYYIALILCAAAIGISGYLYYRNANNEEDPQLQDPSSNVDVISPTEDDQQAVATQPIQNNSGGNPTDSTQNSDKQALKTGLPVAGEIICSYSMDCLSYNETTRDWRVHNGIDIAADAGSQVLASAEGTVYTVYEDKSMGTTVVIRHDNGYVTTYSSMAGNVSVAPGDTVTLGQAIGTVANSALLETALGDHLHFSVTCDDEFMDPKVFLDLD